MHELTQEEILFMKIVLRSVAVLAFFILYGVFIISVSEVRAGEKNNSARVCKKIMDRFMSRKNLSLSVPSVVLSDNVIRYEFDIDRDGRKDTLERTCFGGSKVAECRFVLSTTQGVTREFYSTNYNRLIFFHKEFYFVGGVYMDSKKVWFSEYSVARLGVRDNVQICP